MVDGILNHQSRKLDITTILMMNTVKWTSFAYNYEDGLRKDEELNSD
jgi:lysophospholipid acyltransferase